MADATVPSAIAVLLNPTMRTLRQLVGEGEQETDFPALVVDGPATTVTLVMSEE